jgi:hypothetical protein
MREDEEQRLLTYRLNCRVLFSWIVIIITFFLLSMASVVLLP